MIVLNINIPAHGRRDGDMKQDIYTYDVRIIVYNNVMRGDDVKIQKGSVERIQNDDLSARGGRVGKDIRLNTPHRYFYILYVFQIHHSRILLHFRLETVVTYYCV